MRALLDDATAQLEAGNAEGALHSLVQAWRRKRVPALADVIDLVSPLVTRPSLVTKPLEKQWEQWRVVAAKKDAADLDRLLAVPLPRKWPEAESLLDELSDWPADPRFSRFLAQLVLSGTVYSRIGDNRAREVFGFYHRVFSRLVQLEDTRVPTMLADVRRNESDVYGSWRSRIGEALAPLERLEVPTLTPDEQRSIDALRGRFADLRAQARGRDRRGAVRENLRAPRRRWPARRLRRSADRTWRCARRVRDAAAPVPARPREGEPADQEARERVRGPTRRAF